MYPCASPLHCNDLLWYRNPAVFGAHVHYVLCGEQVIQCQEQFLSIAMDGLLLSRPNLLRPLAGLQQGALAFCARVNKGWDTLDAQVRSGGGGGTASRAFFVCVT